MTYRDMSDVTRIQYLRSEVTVPPTVYEVAARMYAAYVQSGKVETANEKAMMEKAVNDAIELAITTEKTLAGAGHISSGL